MMQVADVFAPRTARPGEEIEITTLLTTEGGGELVRKSRFRIPIGTTPGPINLTVADAATTNVTELGATVGMQFRTPEQLLSVIRGLRTTANAYLRIWRAGNSYTVEGRDLPDPPPSAALILTRAQPAGTLFSSRGAKLAEIEVPGERGVVTGSKTIQIEVRE